MVRLVRDECSMPECECVSPCVRTCVCVCVNASAVADYPLYLLSLWEKISDIVSFASMTQ